MSLNNVEIPCIYCFFIWSFYWSLIIRIILTFLKTMEFSKKKLAYETIFGGLKKYSEKQKKTSKEPDYWRPFILGFLELFIYPILMFTSEWNFIGAWLSFKTLGQWAEWKTNRNTFNIFLIGNALILIVSYVFMRLWGGPCNCK